MYKKTILFAVVVFLTLSLSAQNNDTKESLTIFLVRHAEKVDNSRDPELSDAGVTRAKELAETLKSAKIDQVYSTDFIRTRTTAQPTAALFKLNVEKYNPGKLEEFAEMLKAKNGRFLIVGHSNTTPELVRLLGGEPGKPIVEKNEYDRLYVLTFEREIVHTILLRYGKKFNKID